jgi:hypothetical protein
LIVVEDILGLSPGIFGQLDAGGDACILRVLPLSSALWERARRMIARG